MEPNQLTDRIKVFDTVKTAKLEALLTKGIDAEFADLKSKLTQEERVELKSYAIKKALKLQRYVRD